MSETTSAGSAQKIEAGKFTRLLLYCVLFLVAAGWVMLIDAGLIYSGRADAGQHGRLLLKHALGNGLGFIFLIVAVLISPARLRCASRWIVWASIILLALVFSPLGESVRGSRRWLDLGPFSFQPLEFAKVAIVWYLADILAANAPLDNSKLAKAVWLSVPILIAAAMVAVQPNLSGAIFIVAITLTLAVIGGINHRLVFGAIGFTVPAIIGLFALYPEKLRRFIPMFCPLSDLDGAGYQVSQALWAITNGEIFGRGPGGSLAMYSLPDHTNDFIFPIISEEWGLIGGLLIIGLFALLAYSAFRIALHQNDPFRFLLGVGIAALVGLQACMNIAVTLGWFPTTGVPLPFVSSGGSSVLITFFQVGLIINLAMTAGNPAESFALKEIKKKEVRKKPEKIKEPDRPVKLTPPLSARQKTIYRGPRIAYSSARTCATRRRKVVAR